MPCLRRQPKSTGASSSPQFENWSTLRRQTYGITQVNSRIRREVLPLYREKVVVRIDIRDPPHYITDVILSNERDSSLACGNISIDVRYDCIVDLRDAILLHDCAPNFHLRFTHPGGRNDDMMSILLDAHRWPKFHAYISERTSRLMIDIGISDALVFCPGLIDDLELEDDWGPPLLTWPYVLNPGFFAYVKGLIYVKEDFAEPWMSKSALSAEHWREGLARWCEELGLGGVMQNRCSFRPQVTQLEWKDVEVVKVLGLDCQQSTGEGDSATASHT